MYRPLPNCLTIKKSPIEGLGLYAMHNIKANTFLGITHILDENFENNYIRTPLGGFYNHSNNPNIRRMISNILPKFKCGDSVPTDLDAKEIKSEKASRENLYPEVNARYMFIVTIKDIKAGEEITANYNLYTYPKTGVGIQMI
jgi:SET domain-containing protein